MKLYPWQKGKAVFKGLSVREINNVIAKIIKEWANNTESMK